MDNDTKIEALKGVMASLFASQRTLKALAPEFKWAGLGNLLGDYGEFIAISSYGLLKSPSVSNGYDATNSEGQTVQVKACYASNQIGFRGEADLLLCLKIENDGSWQELYYGDFAPIREKARYSARDNKYMVPLTVIKSIAKKT